MGESIDKVASMALTAYYKGLRPSNGALKLPHFIWLCVAADSKLKQDEYDRGRNINLRMRLYNNDVSMSADNYETVEVAFKDNKVKLPAPIMSFSGDKGTIGVNTVEPVGGKCTSFIRINPDEKWQVCKIKDVVFFYPTKCGIEFINLKEICNPDKIKVSYIPQLTAKSTVQESRKFAILNMVTMFLKAAQEGTIIDMSNDGNANVAQQTEINKYILKALQK